MRLRCALVLLLLASRPADPLQGQEGVFRVTANLVQIDGVVTDSKGRQVKDLQAKDFVVLIDGKRQPITSLSYVHLETQPRSNPTVEIRAPRRYKPGLQPPPPQVTLNAGQVHRTVVLMVDDLGLSWESMIFVRRALRKYVEQQIQPGDLTAIVRTGAGSGIYQQFTNNRELLLAAVEHLRWSPHGLNGINVFEPVGIVPKVTAYGVTAGAGDDSPGSAYEELTRTNFTVGTLGAINNIVEALRGMPGRKSVVLFSDGLDFLGFQTTGGAGLQVDNLDPDPRIHEALRRLIDRANRGGAVIYTIDARGLQTGMLNAADNPHIVGAREAQQIEEITGRAQERHGSVIAAQDGLRYLAAQTGGLFDGGNDMNYALSRVLEDQSGYYLIGFHPDNQLFEDIAGQRRYHKVQVKVLPRHLSVRSRTGFYGETDQETVVHHGSPAEELRAQMFAPFSATGIHIRLTPIYFQSTIVRNLIYLDPHDLTFAALPDGTKSATLDIAAQAVGADNRPFETVSLSHDFQIPAAKFEAVLREGVLYAFDVPVPKPGAYQVRLAVRDHASGKIGSASQFLPMQVARGGRLALTTLVIDDARDKLGFTGITPAQRIFHPGATIGYLCFVRKGQAAHSDAAPETQVRLFRDGKPVQSQPARLELVTDGEWAARGSVTLPADAPAGEYYLQLVASNGHHPPVWQWTDFEVTPLP